MVGGHEAPSDSNVHPIMGPVLVVAPQSMAHVPRLTGINAWHLGYVPKPQVGPARMFGQFVQTENFKLGHPLLAPPKGANVNALSSGSKGFSRKSRPWTKSAGFLLVAELVREDCYIFRFTYGPESTNCVCLVGETLRWAVQVVLIPRGFTRVTLWVWIPEPGHGWNGSCRLQSKGGNLGWAYVIAFVEGSHFVKHSFGC